MTTGVYFVEVNVFHFVTYKNIQALNETMTDISKC